MFHPSFFFGDSFIGIFKLVKGARVYKFKGGTAKGIGKPNHPNSISIQKIIHANKDKNPNACYVFLFGMVDLHFSYYYRLVYDESFNPDDLDSFVQSIVVPYMTFLKRLPVRNKIVLCPYYNPVRDVDVIKQLLGYGIIQEADLTPLVHRKIQKYAKRSWRTQLINRFNDAIEQIAQSPGPVIRVVNANSIISTPNGHIRNKFKDISMINIHLQWEASILAYTLFLKDCGVIKELIDLSNLEDYLIDKQKRMVEKKQLIK